MAVKTAVKAPKSKSSAAPRPLNLMLRKGIKRQGSGAGSVMGTDTAIGLQRDFSKVPLRYDPRPLPIQAKLKIGAPNDRYEQEADRIAEQVLRMPVPPGVSLVLQAHFDTRQRIQSSCSKCEVKLRRQLREEEDMDEVLQAKEVPGHTSLVSPAVQAGIESLRGGGQPLPESVRAFFEPRFGADFSQIRVHKGLRAAQLARTAGARAFTYGQDVVFAAGEYAPQTETGRHLLAHELTHALQQNKTMQRGSGRNSGLSSSQPILARLERPEFTEEREMREARRHAYFLVWLAPAMPLVRYLQVNFDLGRTAAENTAAIVLQNRDRIRQAARGTGARGIPPELLGAVVTMEMMNRRNWVGFEFFWARYIYTGDPSLGLTQLSLSTVAMLEGDIPWTESSGGGAAAHARAREQVATAYERVSGMRREQLVEQLADPLRNLQTAARLLMRLKNRTHRYPSLTPDQLFANYDAMAILGTEYNVGPTLTPSDDARPDDYGRSIAGLASSSAMYSLMGRSSASLPRRRTRSGDVRCVRGQCIQTKLRLGMPNDNYELEAERIADQVMQMSDQIHQSVVISNVQSTITVLQRAPSRIVPDLEDTTVSSISSLLPHAIAVDLRQRIINEMIADRRRKGTNFNIMEGGVPVYVGAFPSELLSQGLSPDSNGVTVPANSPPVNTGNKPLVLIGPMAFGTSLDPLNHRLVRIYSTIMHEYQHVLQWQRPAQARMMGSHRREVEAFFWEIENSRRTGLFRQPGPFQNVWDEAIRHWLAFVHSADWNNLSLPEKARYARWYERISQIVIAGLGSRVVIPSRP